MHPGVVRCHPEDQLATVAATMSTNGVHNLLIAPPDSIVPLFVTDLDLTRAAVHSAPSLMARDMAREPAATISSDAPLSDAVARMAELYVDHILVTDASPDRLRGVISSFDIVAVLGGAQPRAARLLRPAPARPAASASNLRSAMIRDVMRGPVITCAPDVPIDQVALRMSEYRVHSVAVTGVGSGWGAASHFNWRLIDALDVVRAAHRGALGEPTGSMSTTSPPAVNESDSLARAALLMAENETSHVVVIGASHLPVGMVSTLDVASVLAASA